MYAEACHMHGCCMQHAVPCMWFTLTLPAGRGPLGESQALPSDTGLRFRRGTPLGRGTLQGYKHNALHLTWRPLGLAALSQYLARLPDCAWHACPPVSS